jgi:hypothetical protein
MILNFMWQLGQATMPRCYLSSALDGAISLIIICIQLALIKKNALYNFDEIYPNNRRS